MRIISYILIFVLVFGSCKKAEDPTEGVLSVQGVLRTNSISQRVLIEEINNEFGENEKVSGARVYVIHQDEQIELVEVAPGVYEYVGTDFVVIPGEIYNLQVKHEGKFLTSSTMVPQAVNILNQSETEITVDVNTDGEIVFSMGWESNEDYSQVVDLFSVESTPQPVPYVNPIEPFDDLYAFPIPNSSLILKDLNFEFYGSHLLTINLISKEYEELFFYDTDVGQSDIPEGLDNIDGGEGYFTSVSREQIILEILEN